MAVLKYKNGDGQFVTLTNYSVQPITPVQTTGDSLSDIMSQKAVTDELEKKVDESGFSEAVSDVISNDEDVKNTIDGIVADAIENNETVKDAVADAVADAISSASAVTEAVEEVVEDKLTDYYTKGESDAEIEAAVSGKAESTAITHFFGSVNYDSTEKKISFYNESTTGGTVIGEIDTTDFVKDGMIDNVTISGGNLVIVFNTDSGKDPISIPISDIFNADNYYTKDETSGATEIANALNGKADAATTISGYGITDAKIVNGTITLGEASITPLTSHQSLDDYYKKSETSGKTEIANALSDKADAATTISGYGITDAKIVNGTITLGNEEITPLTSHQSLADYYKKSETSGKTEIANALNAKADAATTLSGYGITDAKIYNGTITLGDKSITPLTEHQSLTNYYTKSETSGATEIGTALGGKADVASTLSGYGIEDAKIENGTITLGEASITPLTSHQSLTDYYKKSETSGKTEIEAALSGKSNTGHVHTVSEITDFEDGISEAIATNQAVIDAVNSAITEAITSDTAVQEAIDAAVANKQDASGMTAYTYVSDFSAHTNDNGVHVTSEKQAYWNGKADLSAITEATSGKLDTSAFDLYKEGADASISGKADASDFEELSGAVTAHMANAGIHVTSGDKATWDAKSDFSGDYEDLTNKPTIPTVPTDISAFNNDEGYLKSDDIAGKQDASGMTAYTLTSAFSAHTNDEVVHISDSDRSYWNNKANAATTLSGYGIGDVFITEGTIYIGNDSITPITSLADYYTKDDTDDAIEAAVSGKADVGSIDGIVEAAVSGKADTSVVTGINATLTAHTANTTVHVTSSDKTTWNGKVGSVSLTSGTNNGTVKLTVDGSSTDNIPVAGLGTMAYEDKNSYSSATQVATALGTGFTVSSVTEVIASNERVIAAAINDLNTNKADVSAITEVTSSLGDAAYLNTGTTNGTVAVGNHTHSQYATTGYVDTKVGTAFTSSSVTEVVEDIEGTLTSVSGAAYTAKAVTDYYTGINSGLTSLANIPVTKRMAKVSLTADANNLTLSGGSLPAGEELHIIVHNNGGSSITVTLPNTNPYVALGSGTINIAAGSYGEINIISDGTLLYVRGI